MITKRNLLLAVGVFIMALFLYVQTAIPGLIPTSGVTGDSAELQRAAYRLGIAHSTGYPIFTMVGYMFGQVGDWLGGNPYTWITYSSSVAGALACALFFLLFARWLNPLVALMGAVLLIVTNNFWHISTITEVQALNAIIIIGIIGLTLAHVRHPKLFLLLCGIAFLTGLGIANHRTVVLLLPGVLFAVLGTRALFSLRARQWLILVMLGIVPLLSYAYLYIRALDPFVVHSIRLSWVPAGFSAQTVTNLILGTSQDGLGTFGAFTIPTDDFASRLRHVWTILTGELPAWAIVAGLAGLVLMVRKDWRAGGGLVLMGGIWTLFVMSWRLDAKGIAYYYPLVILLIVGLMFLLSPQVYSRWRVRHPVVMSVASLPLFFVAVSLFVANYTPRNLSTNTDGLSYRRQMEAIPAGVMVGNSTWSPETFILLEYLDDSGRRDVEVRETSLWWVPLDDMHDPNQQVWIGPLLRGVYELYGGQRWLQINHDIGLAGTGAGIFLEAYPAGQDRFRDEAETARRLNFNITPDVMIYSYAAQMDDDGLRLTVYWLAEDTPEDDYSVYTHIRDYGEMCAPDQIVRLIAQDDAFAHVVGTYPTTLWPSGVVIKDTYLLDIRPDALEMASFALVVGMTNSMTGERIGEYCIALADLLLD